MNLETDHKVLEIGTGSGYQAAILSKLSSKVYSIERHQDLFLKSKKLLAKYNVQQRLGDGTLGWPDKSPFDRIIVTAGSPEIPMTLCNQLRVGGFMIVPVGKEQNIQILHKIIRRKDCFEYEKLGECAFVPLIGKDGWSK